MRSTTVAEERAAFNSQVAPSLARKVDDAAVLSERSADASSRFSYFESSMGFIVVAGSQEDEATELALVYGLALRQDQELVLVLPRSRAVQTAIRAAWLEVPIRIFVHDGPSDIVTVEALHIGDRGAILESFGPSSYVDRVHHLGDRASWVESLTAWAGANEYLAAAHRPDNRSWHCKGLRVLRVTRTPAGVQVRAGIDYSEGSGKSAAAITLELAGPLDETQLDRCQEIIDAAIDERYFDEGSMYKPDEHWLQAVLREEPSLVGIEPPALREVPALRCTETTSSGEPRWSRGFIDLLGADPQGSLRLIETKLGSYDLLVLQGLDYYIWAERHRNELMAKLSLPSDAPLEIHFVVGGKGGGTPQLSSHIAPQIEALADDIPWRLHFIEDWFDSIADVKEVHRHDAVADRVQEHSAIRAGVAASPVEVPSSEGSLPWNHPTLRIASDSARTSRYRALQSWFRQTRLGLPPGRDRRGRIVSSMLSAEEVSRRPGLNFVTPEAADYAAQRAGKVLRAGGTLDEDRLRRNMLSSMPMCFNIFGSLRTDPNLPALLSEVYALDISSIEGVECEWAPERTAHLNDRTAFDAFVTYRDSTARRCFLAVETKYTEPFSQKEYDSLLYRQVTAGSGYFREGASEYLMGRATNQLWRMAMLAASMLHRSEFDSGSIAVLSLADDRHARVAVDGVRAQVIEEDFVKFASLEELAERAGQHDGLRGWATEFAVRYLDLTPVGS
jgi:hypothetical protein